MAIGNTNANIGGGSGNFKWVLEEAFNPEETYYERSVEALSIYTKVNLTSSTFVAHKYFKKVLLED